VDVTAFYNDYSDLVGAQPTGFIPERQWHHDNSTAQRAPRRVLRQRSRAGCRGDRLLAFVRQLLTLADSPSRQPAITAGGLELNAPTHQVVLRSSYDFTRHASLDAQFRYVDNVQAVAAYVTADIRLSYRPTANLELSLVGQNLWTSDIRASEPARRAHYRGPPRDLWKNDMAILTRISAPGPERRAVSPPA